jgi:signal peptidase II
MSSSRARLGLVLLILLGTIGCDQAAKQLARASLPASDPVEVGRVLTLFRTENAGAFLSWGSRLPAPERFWVLTVGVGAGLIGGLAYLLVVSRAGTRVLIPLALVAGGGLSNLIDRLARGGTVTDFLIVHVGPLRTGVFNLADVAITAGALALASCLWKDRWNRPGHGAV